jgi:hypothetical protein
MKNPFSRFSLFHLFLLVTLTGTLFCGYVTLFRTDQDDFTTAPRCWVCGTEAGPKLRSAIDARLAKQGFTRIGITNKYEGSYDGSPTIILFFNESELEYGLEKNYQFSFPCFWKEPSSMSEDSQSFQFLEDFQQSIKTWISTACEDLNQIDPDAMARVF